MNTSLGAKPGIWRKLSISQKLSLVSLVLMLFLLPIGILVSLSPKSPHPSRAGYPATPPLPSPSLSRNNPPEIITTALPQGRVGASYQATVQAKDPDAKENLRMTISNLPPGLQQGACGGGYGNGSSVACNIGGTPSRIGTYNVSVSVTDGRGARDTASIKLLVVAATPSPIPTPTVLPTPTP